MKVLLWALEDLVFFAGEDVDDLVFLAGEEVLAAEEVLVLLLLAGGACVVAAGIVEAALFLALEVATGAGEGAEGVALAVAGLASGAVAAGTLGGL